jgi:hypothetical protein
MITILAGILPGILLSCEQYAIFDAIAQEVKPKPALIEGVTSQIVQDAAGDLYAANGNLWKYANGSWEKVAAAPDHTRDVAAVNAVTTPGATPAVYVISVEDSPSLFRLGGGKIPAPGGTAVHGIFGAHDTLFVTAGSGDVYSIYTYDGTTFSASPVASGFLYGAAHYLDSTDSTNHYYLATSVGLYHYPTADPDNPSNLVYATVDKIEGRVLGVIALVDFVVAVTENAGYLVSADKMEQKLSGDSFTGALAISDDTLYLGRTRGYREIDDLASPEFKTPSVTNYDSTMAQVRVTALYALSNDLIFASVLSSEPKRSGLMSLRSGSWNMEE